MAVIRIILALILLSCPVEAKSYRDPQVRAEFMKAHPCPPTGKTRGRCDGWNVDHRIPLCYSGFGLDVVQNMQWLTVEQHREKTKLDVKVCRWDEAPEPRQP